MLRSLFASTYGFCTGNILVHLPILLERRNAMGYTQLSFFEADSVREDEYEFIFVPFVTRKNGRRDYARNHGLKAWRIRVRKRH